MDFNRGPLSAHGFFVSTTENPWAVRDGSSASLNEKTKCLICRNASWARLGISNVHENVGEDHRIVQHVAHHGYRPASRYYDVALLRLEKHVKFSENVKPICLNSNQLLNPRTQIATSWGRASTGRYSLYTLN